MGRYGGESEEYFRRVALAVQSSGTGDLPLPVEQDAGRFKQIVHGQVRRDLKKYMSDGGLIGRQGKDLIRIPLPQIDPPRFRFGERQGGVGQGEGESGDPLGPGEPGGDSGPGGQGEGNHIIEAWELYEIALEALWPYIELPDLLPLPGEIVDKIFKVKGITLNPTGIWDRVRTAKNVMRKVSTDAKVWPAYMGDRNLRIYRDFKEVPQPGKNATVVHIRDFSGSMGPEKVEIVRTLMFWLDMAVVKAYAGKVRFFYVGHDTKAYSGLTQAEVLELSSGGGTIVSTALEALLSYTKENPTTNLFAFYWGDGENSGATDDALCGKLLKQLFEQHLWFRRFCYTQVIPSNYSKSLLEQLKLAAKGMDTGLGTGRFVEATITELDEVLETILALIGKPGAYEFWKAETGEK